MRFEMLGPLRVLDHERVSRLTAHKIEIVLAVLLARGAQVTTTDELMSELWGEHPPRRATASLHVYISQLRKFLARPGQEGSPIVTRPPGYLFQFDGHELDVFDFEMCAEHARSALRAERLEEAAEAFELALGLWRGATLGDLRDGPIISAHATWLEELRLECRELLVDAYLRLGRHRDVIGRLYSLSEEHPLHEAFYRQLMVALYRSERQADALKVYRTAHDRLEQELALAPCRSLRRLHMAILRGDDEPLFAERLDLMTA
ncbi:BTAD domain-containing putative transcriptional regulator [Spirillospora sp. NPDC048911]|uniref:AfsR/SARP family transcriptional regulator n=1 Tax=Spirillospora sp. NPDC048911 TaxID=3364527 RepID=UPI00371F2ADF